MAWRVEYTSNAMSEIRILDKNVAKRVLDYMDERIASYDNPRQFGKALSGP